MNVADPFQSVRGRFDTCPSVKLELDERRTCVLMYPCIIAPDFGGHCGLRLSFVLVAANVVADIRPDLDLRKRIGMLAGEELGYAGVSHGWVPYLRFAVS
jgi:hypothetical protein